MNMFHRSASTTTHRTAIRATTRGARAKAAALLATGLLACAPAMAGFLGHTVQADYMFPTVNTPYIPLGTATAGAGLEFPGTAQTAQDIDFSDTNILLTYNLGWGLAGRGSFDGWVFTDLTASDIVGVTLAGTNMAGLTSSMLSFTGNQVFLNTLGLGSWGAGTFVSIDVQFADPAAVPEPGALGLVGLALLALAAARRPGRASASARPA